MTDRERATSAVAEWLATSMSIQAVIEGLRDEDLDLRGGGEGWSIRETVHHLVEANLIASNIMIAALAGTCSAYDWSWVNPNTAWMERLGYRSAPIGPALTMLHALCDHMAGLIRTVPGALERHVQLLDAPGAKLCSRTVGDLVKEQVEHVEGHIGTIRQIRSAHGR
jgi:hypothetical protein